MPNTVVKLPQLGESVSEGTIGRWLKQPGERVERDEPLVEIQTDKVNAEVPSPVAGILQQILLPEGTTAAVKTDMAIIGDEAPSAEGPTASPPGAAQSPSAQSPAAQAPAAPSRSAEAPAAPSPAAQAPAAQSPFAQAPSAQSPAAPSPGVQSPSVQAPAAPSPPTFSYDKSASGGVVGHREPEEPASDGEKRFYTPVVIRMAQEHDLDLSTIQGTGTHGRVTRKDVERAIAQPHPGAAAGSTDLSDADAPAAANDRAESARLVAPMPPSAPSEPVAAVISRPPFPDAVAAPMAPSTQTEPVAAVATGDQSRPLSPMRRAIADHMARARRDIPDAWSLTEIDVTRLVNYRASLQADWQAREGYELTYLPFFIKAVLTGLRAVPELNATFADDRIIVHRSYHLGIAVSVENGLVVPVLRDADQLSVAGVARALRQLVQKARGGRLALADLQGATFTVNNPGSLGSIMSQPIVPVGQAGIVTMEAIVKRPVVTTDDAIAIRSMMNSCLSFDHRVLDGAGALVFLRTLREQLESIDYPLY